MAAVSLASSFSTGNYQRLFQVGRLSQTHEQRCGVKSYFRNDTSRSEQDRGCRLDNEIIFRHLVINLKGRLKILAHALQPIDPWFHPSVQTVDCTITHPSR